MNHQGEVFLGHGRSFVDPEFIRGHLSGDLELAFIPNDREEDVGTVVLRRLRAHHEHLLKWQMINRASFQMFGKRLGWEEISRLLFSSNPDLTRMLLAG